ncbi:MAG: ribonuclease H-like domain-containing protein [Candidatus Diapherotrites archaeon]
MPTFYFDIETTGLDEKSCKVITIQYQELDRNSGKPIGELVILKEWESSERDILEKFLMDTGAGNPHPFSFVPVGYNLTFEHNFLKERTTVNRFAPFDILNKPCIDLRPIGVIMNRGEFKGSGLDKITGKPMNGSQVPSWYANKEYQRIVEYVQAEAKAFNELNVWLYQKLPEFLTTFKQK